MEQTLILSDIHGCMGTLVRLLNSAPRGCRLVFGGDLIDRGPNSRAVVEFAMENGIPTVAANHDDLCLAFYRPTRAKCASYYDRDVWLHNGGDEAVRNWPLDDKTNPRRPSFRGTQDEYLGGRVPDSVLDWFESLPAYLTPSEELDSAGKRLLLSHTGYGLSADKGDWFQALWGRHLHGDGEFPEDDYYRVLGHTSVKQALVTERWANIDTGAAYADRGGGTLSALLWPSKVVLTQRYDETPVTPTFKVVNGCIV